MVFTGHGYGIVNHWYHDSDSVNLDTFLRFTHAIRRQLIMTSTGSELTFKGYDFRRVHTEY
jgi:hypothetical protein